MKFGFKSFELKFNNFCIQADFRNLAKDPTTERADHYKKPLLEISAHRPDKVGRSFAGDLLHHWTSDISWWLAEKNHGSEWINFDFNFWISRELPTGWQTWYLEHSAKPTWICSSRCGVNARQAGSLCSNSALTDEMCRDKFFRGYSRHNESLVIKNAFKIGWALKNTQEVWPEPRALGSAQKANKLITDTTKGI